MDGTDLLQRIIDEPFGGCAFRRCPQTKRPPGRRASLKHIRRYSGTACDQPHNRSRVGSRNPEILAARDLVF